MGAAFISQSALNSLATSTRAALRAGSKQAAKARAANGMRGSARMGCLLDKRQSACFSRTFRLGYPPSFVPDPPDGPGRLDVSSGRRVPS